MSGAGRIKIDITEDGVVRFPGQIADRLGLKAGSTLYIEPGHNSIQVHRPVQHLARVYVEPTNTCNLGCRTCIRKVWDEPAGWMAAGTFDKLLDNLPAFSPLPELFFGGFGEPLSHPKIMEMLRRANELGAATALISNGIYLTETVASALLDVGLDSLWVSIDGASPESYSDVRLGASLPEVVDQLRNLRRLKDRSNLTSPRLGIAFVAMQRNIADLPNVLKLAARLGAAEVSVSNVLAYTPDLLREVLYERSLYDGAYQSSSSLIEVNLPRMDLSAGAHRALQEAFSGRYRINLSGCETGRTVNRCPFIEKGSTAVRWDGTVSPCLPLLHSHSCYLDERLRLTQEFRVGSLVERSLYELWMQPEYLALRERLQEFDFSPCTFCNSCEMAGGNQEDCFGNTAPACGGCLWAQGLIQCP